MGAVGMELRNTACLSSEAAAQPHPAMWLVLDAGQDYPIPLARPLSQPCSSSVQMASTTQWLLPSLTPQRRAWSAFSTTPQVCARAQCCQLHIAMGPGPAYPPTPPRPSLICNNLQTLGTEAKVDGIRFLHWATPWCYSSIISPLRTLSGL